MKISLLKIARKKEVIKRLELKELAEMIRKNPDERKVFNLRLNYQFLKPQRMHDGQIVLDDQQHTVNLPRILFAAECMNYQGDAERAQIQRTGGRGSERTEDV